MEAVDLKLGVRFVGIRSLDLVVLCMAFVGAMMVIVVLGFVVGCFPCQTLLSWMWTTAKEVYSEWSV